MKSVLLVNAELSLPARDGGALRSWNFVQALKDRYELSLIYLNRRGRELEPEYAEQARQCFADIWSVPIPTRSAPRPDSLSQRLTRKLQMIPWEMAHNYEPVFADALSRVVAGKRFDFILARYIYQAQYLFGLGDRITGRVIVDLDDIEPRKIARQVRLVGRARSDRWRTAANLWTFEQYHRRRLPSVDTCIVSSEDDRRYVRSRNWASRVAVVPNAIDVERYAGAERPSDRNTLLFCGTLNYEPNVDALMWFAGEVLPRLQMMHANVRLLVVGHRPSPAVLGLTSNPSITVHADVPDVRPYYEQAAVVIVPIRVAGGTRIKILEAGACRRPVVSTTIGAEGLGLTPGTHYLAADDPFDFAQRCSALLTNDSLALGLTDQLYRFVKSNYDTAVVFERIRDVFDGAAESSTIAAVGS